MLQNPDLLQRYSVPAFRTTKGFPRRSFAPKHFLPSVMGNHDNIHLHSHPFHERRQFEDRDGKCASHEIRGASALRCCTVAPDSGRRGHPGSMRTGKG